MAKRIIYNEQARRALERDATEDEPARVGWVSERDVTQPAAAVAACGARAGRAAARNTHLLFVCARARARTLFIPPNWGSPPF